MKTITLPEGTTHVPFCELAHLIADALWPDAGEGDDRTRYWFARAGLDTELKQAVQSGDLPVKDPLTYGVHSFPIGNALMSALVTVADLRTLVAPRGLDVQMERLNKGGANWDLWADMEQAKLWEAVALSLDIEPNSLPGLDFRPIVGGPFDDCPDKFKLRLKLAVSKFYDAKTEIRLSSLREWGEQLTRPWTFPDEFPHNPAAIHEPPAPAHNAAAPALVSAADPTPDPERRLTLLRKLGGSSKYARSEWTFKGMAALVASEKANGFKRCDEKTIRADLKEAAQAERDAKSAGIFDSLGKR